MTAAVAEAQTPPGVLFHASFDTDRRAEIAVGDDLPTRGRYSYENYTAGGGTFSAGVFGQAVTGESRLARYDARANVDPARGTIAYFIKFKKRPYGFEPFVIRTVDNYYWLRYLRSEIKPRTDKPGEFNFITSVANEIYRPTGTASIKGAALREETWHHLAVAWDCTQGVRLYVDGEPYASNWGQYTWLAHGVDPDNFWMEWSPDVSYDELWVFDRALTDEQIKALKGRNEPPSADALPPLTFDAEHRRRELSWQQPDPAMPRIAAGAPLAVRQVIPLQARAVMNECNIAIDGKLGGGYPALYGYNYANGNGLHVQTEEPYDYVVIEGQFRGNIFRPRVLLPTDQTPLAQIASQAFLHRWRAPELQQPGWTSFFRAIVEDASQVPDKEQVITGRINELGFYRLNDAKLDGAKAQSHFLLAGTPLVDDPLIRPALLTTFGHGDRTILTTAAERGEGVSVSLPALRYHHVLLPAAAADRVLSGLRLSLWTRSVNGQQIRVELRDPMLPMRRLAAIDAAVDSPAESSSPTAIELTFDVADRIVPAGRPLWLVFIFAQETQLLGDAQHASRIDWLAGSREQAIAEMVAADLPLALARFAEIASPRPWAGYAVPEDELPVHYPIAAELFVPLTLIRRLEPEHPTARALWAWTHKDMTDTSPIDPQPVAGHAAAPRWALLQRELRQRCRDVYQWWIDNRQAPSGEFGDDINDDTDFIQDYPKFVFVNEQDQALRRSAAAVADASIESGALTAGITTSPTDPLHAYENGTNVVAMMALMQDSDPFYRARALEASATVERLLLARDVHGRLRFKSYYFGYNEVRTKGDVGADTFNNALMLHPALTLAYLSGHRKARQTVTEYADGWIAYWDESAKTGEKRLPKATLLDGTITAWDTRVRGFGFSSLFVGAWRLSGEPRHQEAVLRWIQPQFGVFRTGDALATLDAVDFEQYSQQLAAWADQADLAHITVDRFGHVARQRYAKFEAKGDEQAAMDALEASLRNIRTLFDAYTKGEPQNDRIYPPDNVATVMALGDTPHERNQLWPRHYISYGGFSDMAAWVRRKSDRSLSVWLYSFASQAEQGEARLWRVVPGRYRVTLDGSVTSADLHRGESVSLWLEPGRVHELEIELEQASGEDIALRPDAAVSSRQVRRAEDGSLEAVVHNMGGSAIENLDVELRDRDGRTLAKTTIASLPATLDWTPSTATVRFGADQSRGAASIQLDPAGRLAEQTRRNNAATLE